MHDEAFVSSNREVMESLFPNWLDFPVNTLIPRIFYYHSPEQPDVIVFLLLGDEDLLDELKKAPAGDSHPVRKSVSLRENENGPGADLEIHFDFHLPSGRPLTCRVSGSDPKQKTFCEALLRVRKFHLFVADRDFHLVRIRSIAWDPAGHQAIHDLLKR